MFCQMSFSIHFLPSNCNFSFLQIVLELKCGQRKTSISFETQHPFHIVVRFSNQLNNLFAKSNKKTCASIILKLPEAVL